MPNNQNKAVFIDDYLLNIQELDDQNKTLFDLLNKIGSVTSDQYTPLDDSQADNMLDVLIELRDFSLLHFRTEESYMQEKEFPGMAAHKSEHNRLVTDIIQMEAELMNGSAMPSIKIFNSLHNWYRDHILEMDKPFGELYNKNAK